MSDMYSPGEDTTVGANFSGNMTISQTVGGIVLGALLFLVLLRVFFHRSLV